MSDSFEDIDTPECGAMIEFSRVSGLRVLYGSPFLHHGYIRLRINKAQTQRSFHETQQWAKRQGNYIEVDLSFSQFAEAITCMNVGDGVPCTVHRLMGKKFEDPWIDDNRFQLDHEIKKETDSVIESLNELINLIETEKLSSKLKITLVDQCHKIIKILDNRLPFIAQMYAEHLSKLEQKAKTEIAAYCDLAVHQTGLNTLKLPKLQEYTEAQ